MKLKSAVVFIPKSLVKKIRKVRPYTFRGLLMPGHDLILRPGSALMLRGESECTIVVHPDGVIEFLPVMTEEQLKDWAICTAMEMKR